MKEAGKKIVFASNNSHKLEEVRALTKDFIDVLSLKDIGCHDDIPETGDTLESNALIKARWVKEKYGYDCFADDTGLMVDALDGAPGVYSARFAGEHCSPDDNIELLLEKLTGKTDRNARFETVIALIDEGLERLFKGEVKGKISHSRHGTGGFGYDPVFIPEESGISFAEMTGEEKNKISHRGRAVRQLTEFLKQKYQN